MKRLLLLLLVILFANNYPAYSLEIEQPVGVQTLHHIMIVEDEKQNIETEEKPEYDDLYFPNEMELKGSVIYNEGAKVQAIELNCEEIEKPHINLKTANMVIPIKDERIKTNGLEIVERRAIASATRLTGEEYIVKPVWSYITEQTGNFSYGTFYSSGIDTSQLQTTMNIYTRYDFKHFAITGAVGTNESNVEGTVDERTVQISPEIKLSKSFVIRDTIQAYVNENYKKNKISIIYTPQWKKHPDILRFELGLSHTYYTGGKVRSAVEFSTRIRL